MILAVLYALHLIAYPAGWSTPRWTNAEFTRPSIATMGENGAVAIILARWTGRYSDPQKCRSAERRKTDYCLSRRFLGPEGRLLVVRSDGTATSLYATDAVEATRPFKNGNDVADCPRNEGDCPIFRDVRLARDGTPFATIAVDLSGAIMLTFEAVVKWNGTWQAVPPGKPFDRSGDPSTPENRSIGAADTPLDYAYTGSFTGFGLDNAMMEQRRSYGHDIAAVRFGSRTIQLGLGHVTAMRGTYIAGADIYSRNRPDNAVLWHCVNSIAAVSPCAEQVLGWGVAYGVDSIGDAVGSDTANADDGGELINRQGHPVLWRDERKISLSDENGAAYAISENGTIVGEFGQGRFASGFVANARSIRPKAMPLDRLVTNLGQHHVSAALGVANDGRVLAYVEPIGVRYPQEHRQLAILTPQ